jgi:hypothetical protein
VQKQIAVFHHAGIDAGVYSQYISPKLGSDGVEAPAQFCIFLVRYSEATFSAYVDRFVRPFNERLRQAKATAAIHPAGLDAVVTAAQQRSSPTPRILGRNRVIPFVAAMRGWATIRSWTDVNARASAARTLVNTTWAATEYTDTMATSADGVHPLTRTALASRGSAAVPHKKAGSTAPPRGAQSTQPTAARWPSATAVGGGGTAAAAVGHVGTQQPTSVADISELRRLFRATERAGTDADTDTYPEAAQSRRHINRPARRPRNQARRGRLPQGRIRRA